MLKEVEVLLGVKGVKDNTLLREIKAILRLIMATYSFESVIAWQKAHALALLAYRSCQNFPVTERYGLCDQFQRAAVSISANIAEGYKKISKADKLRFFNIAQGSLEECRNYILLVRDLGYVSTEEFEQLRISLEETSKFLNLYYKGIINNNGVKD